MNRSERRKLNRNGFIFDGEIQKPFRKPNNPFYTVDQSCLSQFENGDFLVIRLANFSVTCKIVEISGEEEKHKFVVPATFDGELSSLKTFKLKGKRWLK